MNKKLNKVGVIGAGVIGIGVTQSLSYSGFNVFLIDQASKNFESIKQNSNY